MITRIFRARVPQSLQAEFEKKFLSVSVPYVSLTAAAAPCTGVLLK